MHSARHSLGVNYLFIRASCVFSLSDIRQGSGWLAIIYERLEIPEEKDRPSRSSGMLILGRGTFIAGYYWLFTVSFAGLFCREGSGFCRE